MTTRSANRATAPNDKALESFLATKRRIDDMLARIQTLSNDHFNTDPDAIHWGDVGTLNHYSSLLRQITDSACPDQAPRCRGLLA